MLVRLAFAVMIQVDADILLIDEVLAVGDAAFQQKCFDEFVRIRERGQDDPARHARHGRGAALLRPRDAARARRAWSRSATRDAVGNRYLELNFSEAARDAEPSASRRRPSGSATAAPRSSRRGSRTRRGERVDDAARPAAAARSPRACASTRDGRGPALRRRAPERRAATPCFAASNAVVEPAARAASRAGEEVDVPRHVRQRARARPLPRDAGGRRARAAGSPGSTAASGSPRVLVVRRRAHRRRSSTCRTTSSVERRRRARRSPDER